MGLCVVGCVGQPGIIKSAVIQTALAGEAIVKAVIGEAGPGGADEEAKEEQQGGAGEGPGPDRTQPPVSSVEKQVSEEAGSAVSHACCFLMDPGGSEQLTDEWYFCDVLRPARYEPGGGRHPCGGDRWGAAAGAGGPGGGSGRQAHRRAEWR